MVNKQLSMHGSMKKVKKNESTVKWFFLPEYDDEVVSVVVKLDDLWHGFIDVFDVDDEDSWVESIACCLSEIETGLFLDEILARLTTGRVVDPTDNGVMLDWERRLNISQNDVKATIYKT